MKRMTAAILVLGIVVSIPSHGADARKACLERVQAQIDRINARMRQPYSSAAGEYYREQLRQLSDKRHECRKLKRS